MVTLQKELFLNIHTAVVIMKQSLLNNLTISHNEGSIYFPFRNFTLYHNLAKTSHSRHFISCDWN